LTERTKCVVVNSPVNPTGIVATADEMRSLAELCRQRGVLLISDEVYRSFCYDRPFASPASWNEDVLVVDGFSKAYGMTGWRLGFAHGPRALIEQMSKLQQFSFVCAPSVAQHAGVTAWDFDTSGITTDYRRKRDRVVAGLRERFEFVIPRGAFYLFPRAPWGNGTEFVTAMIRQNLLLIPGATFSGRDTHLRISFAAADDVLDRGIEILNRHARH
jgi:aspartate aminotransferase/aminotransferase